MLFKIFSAASEEYEPHSLYIVEGNSMQATETRINHCDLIVPTHEDGQLDFAHGFQVLDLDGETAVCSHEMVDIVELYEGLHSNSLRLLRPIEANRNMHTGDFIIAATDFNVHRFDRMDMVTYIEEEVAIFNHKDYHYLHEVYADTEIGRRIVFRSINC